MTTAYKRKRGRKATSHAYVWVKHPRVMQLEQQLRNERARRANAEARVAELHVELSQYTGRGLLYRLMAIVMAPMYSRAFTIDVCRDRINNASE